MSRFLFAVILIVAIGFVGVFGSKVLNNTHSQSALALEAFRGMVSSIGTNNGVTKLEFGKNGVANFTTASGTDVFFKFIEETASLKVFVRIALVDKKPTTLNAFEAQVNGNEKSAEGTLFFNTTSNDLLLVKQYNADEVTTESLGAEVANLVAAAEYWRTQLPQ